MKKLLFVIAVVLIMLTGCTGAKTITTGLENESYLVFIGQPGNYSGGVDVALDESLRFKAEVTKGKAKRPKGNVYAIPTGTHTITVTYMNNVVYRKQHFVSAQETKKIILP